MSNKQSPVKLFQRGEPYVQNSADLFGISDTLVKYSQRRYIPRLWYSLLRSFPLNVYIHIEKKQYFFYTKYPRLYFLS